MIRLWDRSRTTIDWQCGRRRYWQYEYDGRGIVPQTVALELHMGTIIHDSLAAIATQYPSINIDLIASTAKQSMFDSLMTASAGESEYESLQFANEQSSLVEGLIRGFYRTVWPKLIAEYPTIIAVEQEMTFKIDDHLTFMSKPDLVMADNNGEWVYIEYKSTSSKREEWINSWGTAIQLHSTIRAVEADLGKAPSSVRVIGLYKGYCLAPDTPVLTGDLQWVTVESLQVGDKIAAFEEFPTQLKTKLHSESGIRSRRRQWKEATVTRTGGAILPSYKLGFDDGSFVVSSASHKWLTCLKDEGSGAACWTTTENLRPYNKQQTRGHRIFKAVEPNKTALGLDFSNNYDLGYLSGVFDGEGHLSQTKGKSGYWQTWAAFTQNPGIVLDKVKSLLLNYSIRFTERLEHIEKRVRTLQISDRLDVMRLLTLTRPIRLLQKFTFDHLGGMMPCKVPPKLISKEFLGLQEVITLETDTGTLIANGFASHNSSYGKQSSPFCYAYARSANPPFQSALTSYEYKAGLKRVPVWELEGGVKAWVEKMPDNILSDQFPISPPIFIKDDMVDGFFKQRQMREHEIALAMQMLETANDEQREAILNTSFGQKFDACQPAYGRGCPYKQLCFGDASRPLDLGFEYRQSHHQLEIEQQESKL